MHQPDGSILFFDMYEVTNPEKLERYRSGVLATVKRYGGEYILVGGKCDIVEGNWRPTFPVLIEFPTLKALRLSGTKNNVVFMESETSPFTSAKQID